MAIEYARTNVISRGKGHSALKSAAYRSGERLTDERLNRVSDYSHRKEEVGHSEILLPDGADESLRDRQTLWNAIEAREDQHKRHASAQLAKDHVIALPRELSRDQQIEMARGFAQEHYVSRGLVVDLNVHYHSDGNPHAHLLTSTRKLDGAEFGLKDRESNGSFYRAGAKQVDPEQIQHKWVQFQNAYFQEHGIDLSVDNMDRRLEATQKLGPTKWMEDKGLRTSKVAKNEAILKCRAATLFDNPSIIVERVSDRKSIFTRHDLYRELHKLVDDAETFSAIKERLDTDTSLISVGVSQGEKELFTSQKVVETEKKIGELGATLHGKSQSFSIKERHIVAALAKQSFLSDEQKMAVRHTLESNRMASVVGLAGAGKSTMLLSMREANEASGHRVMGVALAGKAAEELTESSGIESRTIASFLGAEKSGQLDIHSGDVVVMDEAGMVNNETMKQVMSVVNAAGAKLVLVGDGEQLQPIQAGSPFKTLCEKFGSANIETIRRQRESWQKEATFDLAKGRGDEALNAYSEAGFVHEMAKSDALERLVDDYVSGRDLGDSQAILAHKNADVKHINALVRERLKADGVLTPGQVFVAGQTATNAGIPLGTRLGDTVVFTESNSAMGYAAADRGTYMGEQDGLHTVKLDSGSTLSFSPERAPMLRLEEEQTTSNIELSQGERILFTKNDRELGVKNGMLGTLMSYENGRVCVQLDGGRSVEFTAEAYSNIDHGYATTIHKSQGMTVDKAYLLGSATMDKHLGYVGMSRHRDELNVYLPSEEFEKTSFGEAISRSNHQQSALDLAEKHGLAHDETDVGRTEFYEPPGSGESVESALRDVSTDGVARPGGTDELTVVEAEQILESTRLSLIERMRQDAREHLNGAERELRIAQRAIDSHLDTEPKVGLFGGRRAHEEWSDRLKDLKAETASARIQVSNLKTEFDSNQENFSRIARKEAAARHPEAADVVKGRAVQERVSKALDLYDQLESQLESPDRVTGSSREIDTLALRLDRALKNLGDKDLAAKLSPEQAEKVQSASSRVSQVRQEREGLERDRGGHEL